MPNWCSNFVNISGDPQRIQALYDFMEERGGKQWFDFFVEPAKDDETTDWYSYNLDNYGCKWNCDAMDWHIEEATDEGSTIRITFDSPWGPPIKLYETLDGQDDLSIYAEYCEEGVGFVGKFEYGEDECYEYDDLDDLEDIPEDLVENWCIRDALEGWEDEEDNS